MSILNLTQETRQKITVQALLSASFWNDYTRFRFQ